MQHATMIAAVNSVLVIAGNNVCSLVLMEGGWHHSWFVNNDSLSVVNSAELVVV